MENAPGDKADRWGIYAGLRAPTFMALGNAIQTAEGSGENSSTSAVTRPVPGIRMPAQRSLRGWSTVYPPSAVRTSNEHLIGTTTGMIVTAVVAILALALLLGMVFLAGGWPYAKRSRVQRSRSSDGGQVVELADGQGDQPWEHLDDRHVSEGGYVHGKPASWVLVAVVTAASLTGGISIITHAWVLLWACIAIAVLAVPAGKMIGIMEDTVDWGSTPGATGDRQPTGPQADRGRDQPAQIK